MQNFTICISQPIRKHLKLRKGDHVIISMDEKGDIKLTKALSSLEELSGIAASSFKKLGGGENFLKNERKMWNS